MSQTYTQRLMRMAGQAEPEFLDLHSDRSDWWEDRAYQLAMQADALDAKVQHLQKQLAGYAVTAANLRLLRNTYDQSGD